MIDISKLNNSSKKYRFQALGFIAFFSILVLVLGVFDALGSETDPGNNIGYTRTNTRALYNFTIECVDTTHLTNGGEPTEYTITITNNGTQDDTYLISFEIIEITGGDEADEDDWEGYLDKDSISLSPNDSGEVNLEVYSTCSCQEGFTTTIRVTVESVNVPTLSKFIDTFTEYGPEVNSVDMESEYLSIFSTASAGQTVSISITIYNLQNVAQSYNMNNTQNHGQLVIDYQKESIEIGPNSLIYYPVQITIPEKNEPGYYNLTFHIQSENDPFIEDTIMIPINFYPELAVTNITPSTNMTEPDSEVSFEITVKNLGQAVCRKFPVALYDSTEYNDDDIIETQYIPELFSNQETILTFKWSPSQEGVYQVTAFVNPDLTINEVSNRFGNNYETVEITVKDTGLPADGQDGENTSENGDDQDDGSIMSSPVFWAGIGAVACIVVVLVVVFFIQRSKSAASDNDEKVDRKKPINRGIRTKSADKEKKNTTEKEIDTAKDRRRPNRTQIKSHHQVQDGDHGRKR